VVEADDGVEVHQVAALELATFAYATLTSVRHSLAEPGVGGQDADELDHEAVPQRRGVPVP
jgi:hypothetical protein